MIPFGDKVVDYFRKYESAQRHLDGILHSLRDGQDELRKDNAALNLEKQHLWDAMERLNQYVYVAERLDARLSATIAELEATDPERGQGAARGRAVLRPAEAPGPAHPARRVDPGLPGDRHRHQEQHRADQGRRPGLDDDHLGAAHRGDRGAGAGQPEARARPDHRAEHDDLGDDRAHLARCSGTTRVRIQEQAASATIGLPQLQAAFANIYATMDAIDTFKVQALDTMAATIGTLETEVEQVPGLPRPRAAAGPAAWPAGRSTSAARRDAARLRGALRRTWAHGGWLPGPARRARRERGSARRARRVPPRPTEDDLLASLTRVEAMVAGGRGARPGRAPGCAADRPRPSATPCPGCRSLGCGQPAGVLGDGDRHRLPARGGRRLPAAAARLRRQPAGRPAARRR